MRFEGPKGVSYVWKGKDHTWQLEHRPRWIGKRPCPKTVRRTFPKGNKPGAIIVAKQLAGVALDK